MITKNITLNLNNLDMSTTTMIDAFEKQAAREDWTGLEIAEFIDVATAYDYDHLVKTLTAVCKNSSV